MYRPIKKGSILSILVHFYTARKTFQMQIILQARKYAFHKQGNQKKSLSICSNICIIIENFQLFRHLWWIQRYNLCNMCNIVLKEKFRMHCSVLSYENEWQGTFLAVYHSGNIFAPRMLTHYSLNNGVLWVQVPDQSNWRGSFIDSTTHDLWNISRVISFAIWTK